MASSVLINGMKLKQLREQRALSQEGLEYACSQKKGCSVSIATIKRAELGTPLSRRTAARLANFFSVSIDELISTPINEHDAMPSFSEEKRQGVVVWLRCNTKGAVTEMANRISLLCPLFTQNFGNTLVAALPYQAQERKIYLSLQSALLDWSQFASTFTALVSVQPLSTLSEQQWCLDDHRLNILSELSLQIHRPSVLVSDSLIEVSSRYFSYQDIRHLSGYKVLLQRQQPFFCTTVAREHELSLFRYALEQVDRYENRFLITVSGDEGMGKSHMLNELTHLAQQQGWQAIDYDFEWSPHPLLELTQQITASRQLGQTKSRAETQCDVALESDIAAPQTPILISIDNVHLSDHTHIADIKKIMEDLQKSAAVIAISYLPSHVDDDCLETLRCTQWSELPLSLSPLNKHAMIMFAQQQESIPNEREDSYIEQSNGNPFYYQQLILFRPKNGIPPSVFLRSQDILNNLPPISKQILAILSLALAPFTTDDLKAMLPLSGPSIETLLNIHLIRISHEDVVTVYSPFLAKVLVENIEPQDQCRIYLHLASHTKQHASISDISKQLTLADYYTKGESWHEASRTFLHCGQHCLETGDYPLAQHYLNIALEHQQRAPHLSSNGLLLDIRLTLATLVRVTHGWVSHSTVAAYQSCITLAQEQKCAKRHCISLSGLWVTQLMAMNFELSEDTAKQILALAEESDIPSGKALAYSCLANSQYWLAKHHQAITHAQLAFEYMQDKQQDAIYDKVGINPIALAGCFGSLSATLLGLEDKVIYFQSFNGDDSIVNEPFSQAIALQGEVWVAYHSRQFQQVLQLSDQLLDLADTYQFPFYRGIAMLFKGWAQFFTSKQQTAPSLALVEEGYNHWLTASGDQIAHSLYAMIKAELYIKVQRLEEALALLEEGIDTATQRKEFCYLAPMYAMAASIQTDGGSFNQIASQFAKQQGATLFISEYNLD
ncbi:hypothetical protein [Vibrio ostreicida]|uniref:hypothetical protein n=1 Tax=Vibrio ostreicida TaxID=526588 RepID=UPI000970DF66|nr:hypothetical protein [Vibrio ostreicida]